MFMLFKIQNVLEYFIIAALGMRNQGAADRPSSSSQYGRPAPPSGKPPEEAMEFDPNILWKAMGITPSAMPPSFAPVSDDASHNKRSHNSMQVC